MNDEYKKLYDVSICQHLLMLSCCLLVILFFVWAYYGQLDIVSVAQGVVTPQSKRKEIQHLEGGIVDKILVKEGDKVVKGQDLIFLQGVKNESELNEIKSIIDGLIVDKILLEANEKDGYKLSFSPEMISRFPKLTAQALNIWQHKQKLIKSQKNEILNEIEQAQKSINQIISRIDSNKAEVKFLSEQVELSRELLKDQLTTKYKHLDLERRLQSINGKIKEDSYALQKSRAALQGAKSKLQTYKQSVSEENLKELKKVRQKIKEYQHKIAKYQDSFERTVIKSPVDGIIRTLYVDTIGAVINSGQIIMDIVPSNDTLMIEAHLPIKDIGYVQKNQNASIMLPAIEDSKFGRIYGKVTDISPDTFTDEQGRTFYFVKILTYKKYFRFENEKYFLYPGMVVIVHIYIGSRTIWQYLVNPFIGMMNMSLRER